MHPYAIEKLGGQRMQELRAEADRARLLSAFRRRTRRARRSRAVTSAPLVAPGWSRTGP